MPQDANAILQTLTCVSTSDGSGRSPYLWPVLLWIDDTTLADQIAVNQGRADRDLGLAIGIRVEIAP